MERRYLTVSALNRYLKYKFDSDDQLKNVLLKAEISNFKRHSSGHLYFTLKDVNSEISAIMFSSSAQKLNFVPSEGAKVLVEGYISVYEARGSYQIYVQKMNMDGIGDLYLAYEELKKKLEEAGYFEASHKLVLPRYPKAIGVITSPTGAAVRDIIRVTKERYPLTKIIIYPALVQGSGAKESIVEMIEQANHDNLVDTLIVGRGGGSIEDLWAFNEEIVAKAIYHSTIPVISAVGHETDFTISDFVADMRAATPSQAAEFATPDQKAIYQQIQELKNKAFTLLKKDLSLNETHLKKILSSYIFMTPERIFNESTLRVDYIKERIKMASPEKMVIQKGDTNTVLRERLQNAFIHLLEQKEKDALHSFDKLELSNPLNIMKKGFTVIQKEEKILTTIEDLHPGDQVNILFQDGKAIAKIDKIIKGE
ncbi:MAG: exodeoxyribonuclease VII large subunit [Candidatus Izemoplasmatales bacterium]